MWATGAYGYLLDYLLWWVVLASVVAHTWCFFRLVPPRRRGRGALIVGNLLVLCCMLVCTGLVGETYLRFLSTETDAFGITLTSKRWFRIYPRLNSLFFRDDEWARTKPAGTRRIAFVGDSFTYGWGISAQEDRFTDLLQERFAERSPGQVTVMNAAWVGWGTAKEIRASELLIRDYDVDEVVLCYLPNDLDPLLPVSDTFSPTKPPESDLVNTSASFLFDSVYHRVIARRSKSVKGYNDWLRQGFNDPQLWKKHTDQFQTLIDLCRKHDVTLRIVLLPFIRMGGKHFDAQAVQDKLRGFFEEKGVAVVDLLPTLSGYDVSKLVVNSHDPHPNELANKLFAAAIWRAFYAQTRR